MRLTRRPFIFAAVAAGAVTSTLGPIADGDIYWHLAAGREIWRRRALLRVDPFTLSAAGRPWVDVHWLFQLAAAAIHHRFGIVGLIVAKAVVVAVGALILTLAAERAAGAAARDVCAVALLGLLFLARHLVPVRPIVVTLCFLAIFLLALETGRDGKGTRGLMLLPLLQIVWVNCQGLAPLGPALIGCYLVDALVARRSEPGADAQASRAESTRLAWTLAACVVASFVTPYGLDAVRLPARLFARITPGGDNVFSSAIAENIPPFVLDQTAPEMTAQLRIVLVVLAAAFVLVRPSLRLAHALALAGFGALALMANRNVVVFFWVLAPLGAIALAPPALQRIAWLRARLRWTDIRSPAAAGFAVLAVVAAEIAVAGVALAREPSLAAPTPFHFPTESTRRLQALDAAGPVFAPDQHGGYLAFSVPGLRPYIDTRLVLHSGREYQEYLALFDRPSDFDALDAREHFRYVVLTTDYPDRYLGLIAHLAASPSWKLLFTDGSEVLFGHAGGEITLADRQTIDEIGATVDGRWAGRPEVRAAARLNLARLLVVVGQPAHALRVLEPLNSRAAVELRCRVHFAAGDLAAAEALTGVLLAGNRDDARSLTLMAEIALARREPVRAREYVGRALTVNPYDPEARAVLASVEDLAPRAGLN